MEPDLPTHDQVLYGPSCGHRGSSTESPQERQRQRQRQRQRDWQRQSGKEEEEEENHNHDNNNVLVEDTTTTIPRHTRLTQEQRYEKNEAGNLNTFMQKTSTKTNLNSKAIASSDHTSTHRNNNYNNNNYSSNDNNNKNNNNIYNSYYPTTSPAEDTYILNPPHGNPCRHGNSISKYKIGRLLGKGAFGIVYYAVSKVTATPVALKVLKKRAIIHNKMVDKLRSEVHIHQQLSHPSIVRLFTYFETSNHVYLVLELCENGEVASFIHNHLGMKNYPVHPARSLSDSLSMSAPQQSSHPSMQQPLRIQHIVSLFIQLVSAVKYLHENSILHRDLKMANILLDRNLDLKLADFSLATRLKHDVPHKTTFCGTPNFMSPEIALRKNYGVESDVWALGCVLYYFVVGSAPFNAQTNEDILKNVVQGKLLFPPHNTTTTTQTPSTALTAAAAQFITDDAKDLITRMLRKDPLERIKLDHIYSHPFIVKNLPPQTITYFHRPQILHQRQIQHQLQPTVDTPLQKDTLSAGSSLSSKSPLLTSNNPHYNQVYESSESILLKANSDSSSSNSLLHHNDAHTIPEESPSKINGSKEVSVLFENLNSDALSYKDPLGIFTVYGKLSLKYPQKNLNQIHYDYITFVPKKKQQTSLGGEKEFYENVDDLPQRHLPRFKRVVDFWIKIHAGVRVRHNTGQDVAILYTNLESDTAFRYYGLDGYMVQYRKKHGSFVIEKMPGIAKVNPNEIIDKAISLYRECIRIEKLQKQQHDPAQASVPLTSIKAIHNGRQRGESTPAAVGAATARHESNSADNLCAELDTLLHTNHGLANDTFSLSTVSSDRIYERGNNSVASPRLRKKSVTIDGVGWGTLLPTGELYVHFLDETVLLIAADGSEVSITTASDVTKVYNLCEDSLAPEVLDKLDHANRFCTFLRNRSVLHSS